MGMVEGERASLVLGGRIMDRSRSHHEQQRCQADPITGLETRLWRRQQIELARETNRHDEPTQQKTSVHVEPFANPDEAKSNERFSYSGMVREPLTSRPQVSVRLTRGVWRKRARCLVRGGQ